MHVASLGEYEQGLPILECLKSTYPDHKIVLSFFSPSGYEIRKDTNLAQVVTYLPLDTISNATKFLEIINPELAIFVKYEIWPNYLDELSRRNVPTVLVSALFSRRQIFFKPLGGFMRKSLKSMDHFFVQNESSKQLLASIGLGNVTVSGDTRFDRVVKILNQKNSLSFVTRFIDNTFCLVAGSTWPEDEEILIQFINNCQEPIKIIIAPHEIKPAHIEKIERSITKKTVRYSNMPLELSTYDVLLIDTIGILTKIYSHANLAYIGGGFATGLHNTLEPAVFGIPVITGPKYQGFKEAEDLVNKKGIYPIADQDEFNGMVYHFMKDSDFRKATGNINSGYIQENIGATDLIMNHIKRILQEQLP